MLAGSYHRLGRRRRKNAQKRIAMRTASLVAKGLSSRVKTNAEARVVGTCGMTP